MTIYSSGANLELVWLSQSSAYIILLHKFLGFCAGGQLSRSLSGTNGNVFSFFLFSPFKVLLLKRNIERKKDWEWNARCSHLMVFLFVEQTRDLHLNNRIPKKMNKKKKKEKIIACRYKTLYFSSYSEYAECSKDFFLFLRHKFGKRRSTSGKGNLAIFAVSQPWETLNNYHSCILV